MTFNVFLWLSDHPNHVVTNLPQPAPLVSFADWCFWRVLFFSWGRCRPVQRRGRNWLVSFLARINRIRRALLDLWRICWDASWCHDVIGANPIIVNQSIFTLHFFLPETSGLWLIIPSREGSNWARPPLSASKWRNCRPWSTSADFEVKKNRISWCSGAEKSLRVIYAHMFFSGSHLWSSSRHLEKSEFFQPIPNWWIRALTCADQKCEDTTLKQPWNTQQTQTQLDYLAKMVVGSIHICYLVSFWSQQSKGCCVTERLGRASNSYKCP